MSRCRKAALGGAALPEITGSVGNDGAVSAADYTTAARPSIAQCCLMTGLLSVTMLDVPVSPWLACQECCLPSWLCHCRARG